MMKNSVKYTGYIDTRSAEKFLLDHSVDDVDVKKIRGLIGKGQLISEKLVNGHHLIAVESLLEYINDRNADSQSKKRNGIRPLTRKLEAYRRLLKQNSRFMRIIFAWTPGIVLLALAWVLLSSLGENPEPLMVLLVMSLCALAFTHLLLMILDDLSETSFKFEGFTASGSAAVFFATLAFFNYQYWKHSDWQSNLADAISKEKDAQAVLSNLQGEVNKFNGQKEQHNRFLSSMPKMFSSAPLEMPMTLNLSVRCMGDISPKSFMYEQTLFDQSIGDPRTISSRSSGKITQIEMPDSTAEFVVKDNNDEKSVAGVFFDNSSLINPSLQVDLASGSSLCSGVVAQSIKAAELRIELDRIASLRKQRGVIAYYKSIGDLALRISQTQSDDEFRRLCNLLVQQSLEGGGKSTNALEILANLQKGWDTDNTKASIANLMQLERFDNDVLLAVENSAISYKYCPDAGESSPLNVWRERMECLLGLKSDLFPNMTKAAIYFEQGVAQLVIGVKKMDAESGSKVQFAASKFQNSLDILKNELKDDPGQRAPLLSDAIFANSISLYLIGNYEGAKNSIKELSNLRTPDESTYVIDSSVDMSFLESSIGDIGEPRHGAKSLLEAMSLLTVNKPTTISERVSVVRQVIKNHRTKDFQLIVSREVSDEKSAEEEVNKMIVTFRDVYPELSSSFPFLTAKEIYKVVNISASKSLIGISILPQGSDSLTLDRACTVRSVLEQTTDYLFVVRGPADWGCSV